MANKRKEIYRLSRQKVKKDRYVHKIIIYPMGYLQKMYRKLDSESIVYTVKPDIKRKRLVIDFKQR